MPSWNCSLKEVSAHICELIALKLYFLFQNLMISFPQAVYSILDEKKMLNSFNTQTQLRERD